MKLVIGNKTYSSWSLRPWLLLSFFGLEFEEIQESLAEEGRQERFGQYSPTSKVPVLIDGDIVIWDSLAICEYISEQYLDNKGWPADTLQRATARAISCEMHSGFLGVRNELPMNCPARRVVTLSETAQKDITRIDQIWSSLTHKHRDNGPWLFGEFSIADCFFAPVAFRFQTYNIELSVAAQNYCSHLLSNESTLRWLKDAQAETEVIPADEAGTPVLL